MSKRMLRLVLSVACALSVGAAVPATGGAVVIGIGDQTSVMFSDPRFLALGITTARTVVPWDVMTRRADRGDLAYFRGWLQAAQGANVKPLISFGADFTNPAANYIPTVSQYKTAVKAFLKAFPQITTYTAWNEPDFSYRTLARNQTLAANYFNALYEMCRRCTVLAGDVYLPTVGPATIDHAVAHLGPWLRPYIKALRHRPVGWALHDYFEVRGRNTSQLQTLMSMTSGPIWLDETGGVLRRGHWQYRNQSAAAAARDEQFLLSLSKRYHRIARIYHYQWQGNGAAGWDSGLVAPNGQLRPAYTVLRNWIGGGLPQAY
jgi:Glycosyl hydrolase catalytic core